MDIEKVDIALNVSVSNILWILSLNQVEEVYTYKTKYLIKYFAFTLLNTFSVLSRLSSILKAIFRQKKVWSCFSVSQVLIFGSVAFFSKGLITNSGSEIGKRVSPFRELYVFTLMEIKGIPAPSGPKEKVATSKLLERLQICP